MPSDFTVIQAVRQRFGDQADAWEVQTEQEAPFVGAAKDFAFSCPGVLPAEWGVLQFGTLGVFKTTPILRINGVDIPGAISAGPGAMLVTPAGQTLLHTFLPFWGSHSLLVPPGALREQNTLHVESTPTPEGDLDNFILDNVVVFFKTPAGSRGLPTPLPRE